MKKLVLLGTDENYLTHIKYNINNIRDKHGEIDICIIYDENKQDLIKPHLQKYNVLFLPIKSQNNKTFDRAYHLKYHVFENYFKNWDKILYLDCDTMVFENLDKLFNLLNNDIKLIVDFEKNKIKDFFTTWSPRSSLNEEYYKLLEEEIDINRNGFNAGILLYDTSIIESDTINQLYYLDKKYEIINKHVEKGSDQPIINILYSKIAHQIPNNYFSFWTLYNNNNVASHFCRWDPPWANNTFNEKINMTYTNYYNKMLNKLD
jgi:lipopolysaccharide biosynthesis glycosyltransferase